MGAKAATRHLDVEGPTLDEQEDAFVDAQVQRAMAAFEGKLPEADLEWMRERLIEQVRTTAELYELVRASAPRDVFQSAEVPVTRRRKADD